MGLTQIGNPVFWNMRAIAIDPSANSKGIGKSLFNDADTTISHEIHLAFSQIPVIPRRLLRYV
jgi:N-acetylglutamate synthase-like GNAT family acetyltransferase